MQLAHVRGGSLPAGDVSALTPVAAPGRAGRTLAAVYLTIDAARRDRDNVFSRLFSKHRAVLIGGLRAGRARVTRQSVDLRAYETVRGVQVSSKLTDTGNGEFVVTGRSAGKLHLRRGRVTGTLGGHRIVSRAPAPA